VLRLTPRIFMSFSIRSKLFAAFGVVLALLIAVAVVGLSGASSVNSSATTIAKGDLPSVDSIDRLEGDVQAFRRFETALAATSDQKIRDSYVTKLAERGSAITKRLDAYEKLVRDDDDRRFLDQVKEEWASYTKTTTAVPALAKAGRTERISQVI